MAFSLILDSDISLKARSPLADSYRRKRPIRGGRINLQHEGGRPALGTLTVSPHLVAFPPNRMPLAFNADAMARPVAAPAA